MPGIQASLTFCNLSWSRLASSFNLNSLLFSKRSPLSFVCAPYDDVLLLVVMPARVPNVPVISPDKSFGPFLTQIAPEQDETQHETQYPIVVNPLI